MLKRTKLEPHYLPIPSQLKNYAMGIDAVKYLELYIPMEERCVQRVFIFFV